MRIIVNLAGYKRKMKEERKRVISDTLVKNKLRHWKSIFYCRKPSCTPPKVCRLRWLQNTGVWSASNSNILNKKYYFNGKLCHYPQTKLIINKKKKTKAKRLKYPKLQWIQCLASKSTCVILMCMKTKLHKYPNLRQLIFLLIGVFWLFHCSLKY
jgi:hypothetical protein